jgi:hypothetical protein
MTSLNREFTHPTVAEFTDARVQQSMVRGDKP